MLPAAPPPLLSPPGRLPSPLPTPQPVPRRGYLRAAWSRRQASPRTAATRRALRGGGPPPWSLARCSVSRWWMNPPRDGKRAARRGFSQGDAPREGGPADVTTTRSTKCLRGRRLGWRGHGAASDGRRKLTRHLCRLTKPECGNGMLSDVRDRVAGRLCHGV
ncbi:hypothetical protein GUJ93_ZPchr0010g10670 [Zizania palustris]|uniref:Uncharacterized protein n=1 Tax=Zizania palustris TaxID=103762 RepID=A0A8J6BQ79_ZIZPA|nr:hypothetical protein GUJ93_ZPchr0010g10670 [Zizania palustris]